MLSSQIQSIQSVLLFEIIWGFWSIDLFAENSSGGICFGNIQHNFQFIQMQLHDFRFEKCINIEERQPQRK